MCTLDSIPHVYRSSLPCLQVRSSSRTWYIHLLAPCKFRPPPPTAPARPILLLPSMHHPAIHLRPSPSLGHHNPRKRNRAHGFCRLVSKHAEKAYIIKVTTATCLSQPLQNIDSACLDPLTFSDRPRAGKSNQTSGQSSQKSDEDYSCFLRKASRAPFSLRKCTCATLCRTH